MCINRSEVKIIECVCCSLQTYLVEDVIAFAFDFYILSFSRQSFRADPDRTFMAFVSGDFCHAQHLSIVKK